MQPRSWSRACKTGPWIKLLSGLIYEPSTVQRGVESWIASRRVIRASHSLSRDHAAAFRILAICGRTSRASSATSSPQSSFWRTSPAICPLDSIKSVETWDAWVTGLRLEYSRRRKLARRTDASDCLRWPSPDANTATYSNGHNGFVNIREAATSWQTPSVEQFSRRRQVGQETRSELLLIGQARAWATPRANGNHQYNSENSHQALGRQALTATGPELSDDSGRRSLNPSFVEWLMGMPDGWTDFAPLGMEWSHSSQPTHSEPLRVNYASEKSDRDASVRALPGSSSNAGSTEAEGALLLDSVHESRARGESSDDALPQTGASPRDGGETGTFVAAGRGGSPYQREQARQPTGEFGTYDERGAQPDAQHGELERIEAWQVSGSKAFTDWWRRMRSELSRLN